MRIAFIDYISNGLLIQFNLNQINFIRFDLAFIYLMTSLIDVLSIKNCKINIFPKENQEIKKKYSIMKN